VAVIIEKPGTSFSHILGFVPHDDEIGIGGKGSQAVIEALAFDLGRDARIPDLRCLHPKNMACILKGKEGSGRRLGKIKHGPFMGKNSLKEDGPGLAFGYGSELVGNAVNFFEDLAIELLGYNHVKKAAFSLETLDFVLTR
jgi:hypothetical protein